MLFVRIVRWEVVGNTEVSGPKIYLTNAKGSSKGEKGFNLHGFEISVGGMECSQLSVPSSCIPSRSYRISKKAAQRCDAPLRTQAESIAESGET